MTYVCHIAHDEAFRTRKDLNGVFAGVREMLCDGCSVRLSFAGLSSISKELVQELFDALVTQFGAKLIGDPSIFSLDPEDKKIIRNLLAHAVADDHVMNGELQG